MHKVVTVDDGEVGEAVLLMLERIKLLAEGAGAAAIAAARAQGGEVRFGGRALDRPGNFVEPTLIVAPGT